MSGTLVLLALLAQLWLPVARAAMPMGAGPDAAAWCTSAANRVEALASLPAEVRDALDQDGWHAEHIAQCAKLCALGASAALVPTSASVACPPPAVTVSLVPARPTVRALSRHALPPPSQGPPRQG